MQGLVDSAYNKSGHMYYRMKEVATLMALISQITPLDAATERLLMPALQAMPRALCTDVDGTIAPIAPTPESARLIPGVAAQLGVAQAQFAVTAVVSGRDLPSLWQMVAVPGLLYIGDHGNAWWQSSLDSAEAPLAPTVEPTIAATLSAFIASGEPIAGVRVEAKGATAAIHYRNVTDPVAARLALIATLTPIAAANGTLLTEGKAVIEVRAPHAMNKGTALQRLVAQQHLKGLIYLGDDRTDIDAFDAARTLRAAGVCHAVAVGVAQAEAPRDLAAHVDVMLAAIDLVPPFLAWVLANTTPTHRP